MNRYMTSLSVPAYLDPCFILLVLGGIWEAQRFTPSQGQAAS